MLIHKFPAARPYQQRLRFARLMLLFAAGLLFACGCDQQSDEDKFLEHKDKAEQGDAAAQFKLGECYERGRGVNENEREAVEWYRKAAEKNYAPAQTELGTLYRNGIRGVKNDPVEAVKWFRKAAEQNDPDGQCSLGVQHEIGEGVEKNQIEAVKWFRKAAEQNDAGAQMFLGDCYAEGKGVKQDWAEAYAWYSLRDSRRVKESGPSLMLKDLKKQMSKQQISAGESRRKVLWAQLWVKGEGKWIGAALILFTSIYLATRRRRSQIKAGYIDNNLYTGELILVRASVSNSYVFLRPLFPLVVGVPIGIGVGCGLNGAVGAWVSVLITGISICILVSIPLLVSGVIRKITTEIALTNLRVIAKHGVLHQRIAETPLDKCDGLAVDQGLLGRLFGYGDILVRGAGGVAAQCPGMASPKAFRLLVNKYIENTRLTAANPPMVQAATAQASTSIPTPTNVTQHEQLQPRPKIEIHFICPHCAQHIAAPTQLAGTYVGCPACGVEIAVPMAT